MNRSAPPRFSILTAVYDPPLGTFVDTVASVRGQGCHDWEWILVDDRSTDPGVRAELAALAAAEPRVTVYERAENGGIAAASDDALGLARGEYVVLLDHDDVLESAALATIADAIEGHPDADYLYSDQDRMRDDGDTHATFRKPAWSPERLRHHMYTAHVSVLRRELAIAVGGFRPGYDGSQDHDLVLRLTERAREVVHVPQVLYHWREVPGSAAADAEAKPWAWDAGVRAVQDHLDRVDIRGRASKGLASGTYRVERDPDLTTPVSIIISTSGAAGTAYGTSRSSVVETICSLLESSQHRDLEVVVVHDWHTPVAVLADLRALPVGDVRLELVEYLNPLNLSEKRNLGALHATGEVLVFLDDGVEALTPGVVERLIAPLGEPGVGATGAKLLSESSHVEHAGLVYGSGRILTRYDRPPRSDHLGPLGELTINREVTALTGACVAVRREVFDEVGGFAEELPLNYGDLDFSLKIGHVGHRLLWLHDVVLVRLGSTSPTSHVNTWEKQFVIDRWGDYDEIEEQYAANLRPGQA